MYMFILYLDNNLRKGGTLMLALGAISDWYALAVVLSKYLD